MKHVEVVCAIIKKDELFFACQRGQGGECAFKWEFPGGKIELNELKEQAIKREIKEELNSIIDVDKYLISITHMYKTFEITMHAFLCTLKEGNLELSEHVKSKWVTLNEMKEIDFADADIKIIEGINSILNNK